MERVAQTNNSFIRRAAASTDIMRLIGCSKRKIILAGLAPMALIVGVSSCGFLIRPSSIKLNDSARAVADARKLIADERQNPSRPMRSPNELPESLRIPGLRWADIWEDHINLVMYHDPMVTRGARIWSVNSTREHKDTPTKYPDVYFFDYNQDAPKAPDNLY